MNWRTYFEDAKILFFVGTASVLMLGISVAISYLIYAINPALLEPGGWTYHALAVFVVVTSAVSAIWLTMKIHRFNPFKLSKKGGES